MGKLNYRILPATEINCDFECLSSQEKKLYLQRYDSERQNFLYGRFLLKSLLCDDKVLMQTNFQEIEIVSDEGAPIVVNASPDLIVTIAHDQYVMVAYSLDGKQIGCDITVLSRYESLSESFVGKVLSAEEKQQYLSIEDESKRIIYLATSFATKEAYIKARRDLIVRFSELHLSDIARNYQIKTIVNEKYIAVIVKGLTHEG